ncbi:MAG: thiamine ABC transporter substrate-binding protein [Thermodesulfobacteriota bacterium]|nr:thiamine ABC transporter substrate-binding protein [Thermodesulfobacteriota bacterium]
MKRYLWLIILVLVFCGCDRDNKGTQPITLTIMTHDSFSIGEKTVKEFEGANHVTLRFIKAGDAGEAINKAILSRNNPMADVFYGVDNTFLSRALKGNIFEPYDAPMLSKVSSRFMPSGCKGRLTPVDYGDVCLNYDKAWFKKRHIAPPACLEDLVKPEYRNLLVVENPATSSPGLAFLFTTIGHFGEQGYIGFWKGLKANNVLITNGWEDAYWGRFSASSQGDRPIVVSYATSPPAEVHFAEERPADAPTAAVLGKGSVFRQIEYAGILKGTKHPELSRRVIDWFLSRKFQEDIPLQMFVFPVNADACLPEVFKKYAGIADNPVEITPEEIAANRDKWIQAWTQVMLR